MSDFTGWTWAELDDAVTRTERLLQPDLIGMISDSSIASERARLHRLKRERTRRWIAQNRDPR